MIHVYLQCMKTQKQKIDGQKKKKGFTMMKLKNKVEYIMGLGHSCI